MERNFNKKIILEDGSEYYGYGFGADCSKVTEIVFNTSMVGYQEIISDPSYTYQAVVMTYPLIGNYGMADDDYETKTPTIGGLVVREYNDFPSNFRSTKTLGEVMQEYNIPGVYGVDTRKLTRSIRDYGSRKAYITDADTPVSEALEILSKTDIPRDAVSKVSCKEPWLAKSEDGKFKVVAIDCGMKLNIVRSLCARGCDVTVVPWNTSAAEIEKLSPDGVFIFDVNSEYRFREVFAKRDFFVEEKDVSLGWKNVFHEKSGICDFELTLFVKEKEDLYRKFEETHYQRAYSLDTVRNLVERSGLRLLHMYDAFTREPAREDSERIYVICQREKTDKGEQI